MLFICCITAVTGVAVSMRLLTRLPVWGITILLISWREMWMFSHGAPNDPAPFIFPFIVLSAAEAFFLASRQYKQSTRWAMITGGALIVLSTFAVAAAWVPAQARVQWKTTGSREWMITHQVVYGSVAVWMLSCSWLYRWMIPVPWTPPALLKHIALLAIYAGLESAETLITNRRMPIGTMHLPVLFCLVYAVLFIFWLRIPLPDFDPGAAPAPASEGALKEAQSLIRGIARRLEKKTRNS